MEGICPKWKINGKRNDEKPLVYPETSRSSAGTELYYTFRWIWFGKMIFEASVQRVPGCSSAFFICRLRCRTSLRTRQPLRHYSNPGPGPAWEASRRGCCFPSSRIKNHLIKGQLKTFLKTVNTMWFCRIKILKWTQKDTRWQRAIEENFLTDWFVLFLQEPE